jgi:rod shape-determining protein MreD
MHPLRLALVILMAAILQVALNNLLNFAFRPDLLVILLVFLVANTEGNWPIIVAFAVGFAADLISLPIGPHTIAFGVAGSLLALSRRSITFDNPILVALAILVVCLAGGAFAQLLIGFRQQTPPGAYRSLLWTGLASAVIGPYLYSILSAASSFLGAKQPRSTRRGK